MKMVQGTNTNRVLTIAGSVALIALTTYGIWKWNQTDASPSNKEDEKKKSIHHGNNSRQVSNDKVEEQSRVEVEQVTEVKVEETETEAVIDIKETTEVISGDREIVDVTESIVVVDKQTTELEEEIKKELEQVISEIKDEDYVVVSKEEQTVPAVDHSCGTSSTEETDVWTPEHEATVNEEAKKNTPEADTSKTIDTTTPPVTEEYIWKADAVTPISQDNSSEEWAATATAVASAVIDESEEEVTAVPVTVKTSKLSLSAPVFVPRQQQPKKSIKKRLSRSELIEQQRQNHTPHAKARCSHWPRCTNKNCKFWHPFKDCREGEDCSYGDKCMFIHPSDYLEPPRFKKTQSSDEEDQGQYIHNEQFQFAS